MLRRFPAPGLALSILAYFALWMLVPRALFIPHTLDAIDHALRNAHGLWATILVVVAGSLDALPTIAFMAVQIAIIYFYAKLKMTWWQCLLALAGFLIAAWAIFVLTMWNGGVLAKMHRFPTLREQAYLLSMYFGPFKMVISLLMMLAAASVGYTVSTAVRDKNLLLPVVMFAACIDFWTVNHGPVSTMMQSAPEVASAVMAPIPKAGAVSFQPLSMIGPGDFLFMALVFAVVHKLCMNPRRNYVFVTIAMTIGMLAVLYIDQLPFLPALITLGTAVVAANWRQFKLTREEKISTAIVAVLLAASLPLVWALLKPTPEPPTNAKPARPPVSTPAEPKHP